MVGALMLGGGVWALIAAGVADWPLSLLLAVVAFALGTSGGFVFGMAVRR